MEKGYTGRLNDKSHAVLFVALKNGVIETNLYQPFLVSVLFSVKV